LEDSTNKTIFFYIKSDKKNGYGHLVRQVILYKYLKKKKIKCFFLNDNLDKKLAKKLELKVVKFNLEFLLKKKNLNKRLLLIIDRYDISDSLQKKIIKRKIKFLIFDNINSLKSKFIYSDIAVNIDPSVKKNEYIKRSKNKKIKLLLGNKYSIIRSGITGNETQKYNYVILLGGGDNIKTIKKLILKMQKKIKKKSILIITGFINKNLTIKTLNQNKIIIKKYIENPLNYMKKSENLICGGGTVFLESLQHKINRHVIVTAKNQESIIKYYYKKKFISNLLYSYKNKITNSFISRIVKTKINNTKKIKKRFKGEQLVYKEIQKILN